MKTYSRTTFDRYLNIIGIERSEPDLDNLTKLSSAHLRRIPFENVSKIYLARVQGIREVPELELYLDNIERYNFGGTCYANNYYLHLLLLHLNYNVRLCGADIAIEGASPNGHMVNVVTLDETEYLVDVGYGAPFWKPMDRNSSVDVIKKLGVEKYVLKPQDSEKRSRMMVYKNDELIHGYLLKPQSRQLTDFSEVIANSYSDKASFLNRLLLARFFENRSLVLRNNKLTEMNGLESVSSDLNNLDEIAKTIIDRFNMPAEIVYIVLDCLKDIIQ